MFDNPLENEYCNWNGKITHKNRDGFHEELFTCRTGEDGEKALKHLNMLKRSNDRLAESNISYLEKITELNNEKLARDTKLTVSSDEDDPYTLKVSGQIRPIIARDKYDFTHLVDSLIKQGYTRTQARDIVLELVHEIVEELNKKEEETDI